jgi:uncharacterized protein YndB with AHSA1/START domain
VTGSVRQVRVTEAIDIARPPEVVWDFVVDPTNDPRWCRKVKSVRQIGPQRWQVLHKPVPLRPSVELKVEHLQREEVSRLAMREHDDASVFEVEYRLEPIALGTRFTQVSEFEWKKLPGVLQPLFTRGVRRDVQGQLVALKRVLESGA